MTNLPDPAPFTPPALAALFRTPSPRKAPTMTTTPALTFHGGPPLAVCRRHPVTPLEVHLATHDGARIAAARGLDLPHTVRDLLELAAEDRNPAGAEARERSVPCRQCQRVATANRNAVCDQCQPDPELTAAGCLRLATLTAELDGVVDLTGITIAADDVPDCNATLGATVAHMAARDPLIPPAFAEELADHVARLVLEDRLVTRHDIPIALEAAGATILPAGDGMTEAAGATILPAGDGMTEATALGYALTEAVLVTLNRHVTLTVDLECAVAHDAARLIA